MWVVKLGGSLSRDPLLKDWLECLLETGGGRVVIVPGGGAFADQVRTHQAHWHFDDLAAHNMAILAMAQYGIMLRSICPQLVPAPGDDEIRRALRKGRVPLWQPLALMRDTPDELTHWGATSDSLSAWLAKRLHAERLVLVKACPVDAEATLASHIAAGIVDQSFDAFTRDAHYATDVVGKSDLRQIRALLRAAVPARHPFNP